MKTIKIWIFTILLTLMGLVFSNKVNAQETYTVAPDAENWSCGMDEDMMKALVTDTGFVNRFARFNNDVNGVSQPQAGAPFIVPVVFHVVSTTSVTSVLPYNQIKWQLARLNAAFSNSMTAFNGQAPGARAVNTQIIFRLACVAQNSVNAFTNASEPGVMRYASANTNVLNQITLDPTTYTPMLAITHPTAYPTTFPFANYLNIWCVPNINTGSTVGYGTFPWTGAGLDGIVMRIDAIGNNSYPTNFTMNGTIDKGSILAHEAGHYLGLFHTFETVINSNVATAGGSVGCFGTTTLTGPTDGDMVLDVPPTKINFDLGSMPTVNSCNETNYPYGGPIVDQADQLENYMSYSDDDKINTFTAGQTTRMIATFTLAGGTRFNLNTTANLNATGVSSNTCSVYSDILTGIFNYSMAPGSSCSSVNIQFTNPTSIGFAPGTTYSWTFGDGGTGSGANPIHTYTAPLSTSYSVTCVATNGTNTATFGQMVTTVYNVSITGQSATTVCRGTEQTIFLTFSAGVSSVLLTNGTNTITVYNSKNLASFRIVPYTFVINGSCTYSIASSCGTATSVATFSVIDCCNSLITNGDFSAGTSGITTQLTNTVFPGSYPFFGTYTICIPNAPGTTSLWQTFSNPNITGNAMVIDGFCNGADPTHLPNVPASCSSTLNPNIWKQTITGLLPSQTYYYSFKLTENFNSSATANDVSCLLNFETKITSGTLTIMPTATVQPNYVFTYFGNNPNGHIDFIVYAYTFSTTAAVTATTPVTVELNQINHFQGSGWDFALDNITLNQMTPSVQAIGSVSICPAQTATLNAVTSCNTSTTNFTYVWTPSTGLSNPNIINPVASPSTTTIYTLVATPTVTGVPASITTVTITVRPTFTITPSSQIVYSGNSATLTVSGSTGTYSWNPGALTGNSVVVTPTATTVYTVTNAASGTCTANNTSTVTVSAACSQTASALYRDQNFPASTTIYTVANTVYDMQGIITFTGNTTFTGYTLRMDKGVKLVINNNVTVTFDNCKLFGCTELWYGIQVLGTSDQVAAINVTNGTTVEDMYYGIYRDAGGTTGNQSPITITNSKLNKNYIGVQLLNMPAYNPSGSTYSLTVKTSTLSSASSTTSPGNTLKPSTISTYTYAYTQIAGGTSGPTASYTAFPRAYIGINLNNLSTTNNVLIGDSAGASNTFNAFSNMDFGINAVNAQLRVHNNTFTNLKGSTKQSTFDYTPDGPNEIGIAVCAQHTVANTYSLQVGTGTITTTSPLSINRKANTFKTLNKGILANNCNIVIAKGNAFDGDTTSILPDILIGGPNTYEYYKGQNAVWITGLSKGATINNNYVRNYSTGLSASQTISVTTGAYITIASNNIQSLLATGFCKQAINLAQVGGANLAANALEVKLNTINKVFSAIYAKSILGGLYIHDNSSITLDNVKTYGVSQFGTSYYGIYLQSVTNGLVTKNLGINSTGTVTAGTYSVTNGIFVNTSSSNTITCNTINNVGRAFTFQANCTSNQGWLGNGISNSHTGLEVRSTGIMGVQGAVSSTLAANTWSNVTRETYVVSTGNVNSASKMYVEANSTYTTAPSLNSAATATQAYVNAPAQGIDIQATGTPFSCSGGGGGGMMMSSESLSTSGTTSSNDEGVYTELATASSTLYPEYEEEFVFQNKKLVYKLQKQGLVTKDASNPTLQSFYNSNTGSNIGKFTDVEITLAANNKTLALSKNNNISPTNSVQQKTKRANELMLKLNINCNYKFNSTELQDLQSMANECSVKGWYVVESRNILDAVNGFIIDYYENCGDNKGSRIGSREESITIDNEPKRSFNLFPNPNVGSMTMIYDLGNDKEGNMYIYDVTGKLINNYTLPNTIGSIEINETSLHNGIYFYRILVNGNIVNTNKIVIIK